MKFSVIVPAYQAENTISHCLDSLLAGIRNDAEILVVNDGSTDRTDEICLDYAARHPRIRYFYRDHSGVSGARNFALDHAQGEYIMFVDSDDYVTADFYDTIEGCLTPDCDFLMFGSYVCDGFMVQERCFRDQYADSAEKTARVLRRALTEQSLNPVHGKVFRSQIINDFAIRFDERLSIGEDKVFVVQYVVHAANVRMCSKSLYIMCIDNEESLSRRRRRDLCDHVLLEHRLLFDAVEGSPCERELKKAVSFSYHRSAYSVIRELRKFGFSKQQRMEEIKEILRKYNRENRPYCYSLNHWVLALPIRMELAGLIDFVLRRERAK